jgi:hypothetical protein
MEVGLTTELDAHRPPVEDPASWAPNFLEQFFKEDLLRIALASKSRPVCLIRISGR